MLRGIHTAVRGSESDYNDMLADIEQEMFEQKVKDTVVYFKQHAKFSEIEELTLNHLADPKQFVDLAILAFIKGNIEFFMEAQLTALCTARVEGGR